MQAGKRCLEKRMVRLGERVAGAEVIAPGERHVGPRMRRPLLTDLAVLLLEGLTFLPAHSRQQMYRVGWLHQRRTQRACAVVVEIQGGGQKGGAHEGPKVKQTADRNTCRHKRGREIGSLVDPARGKRHGAQMSAGGVARSHHARAVVPEPVGVAPQPGMRPANLLHHGFDPCRRRERVVDECHGAAGSVEWRSHPGEVGLVQGAPVAAVDEDQQRGIRPQCREVVERFGGTAPTPRQLLRAPEQTLREVGLSGRKVEYLRDLATQVLSPRSPIHRIHEMPDDEVITHLTALRGIGVWTTQMVLMFRLGRLDILPTADLVIQKGVKILYSLRSMPTPERLERIGKPWAPYRTIACWYIWRVVDQSDEW